MTGSGVGCLGLIATPETPNPVGPYRLPDLWPSRTLLALDPGVCGRQNINGSLSISIHDSGSSDIMSRLTRARSDIRERNPRPMEAVACNQRHRVRRTTSVITRVQNQGAGMTDHMHCGGNSVTRLIGVEKCRDIEVAHIAGQYLHPAVPRR